MSVRDRALQFRREHGLPADLGYVILHRGQPGSWVLALSRDNAREWVPGCLAVPAYHNAPIFVSAGNDSGAWVGSESWQRLEPIFEREGLL